MGHLLCNLPRFSAAVWHTQRMANFVTIFRCRFIASVWHSLKSKIKSLIYIERQGMFLHKETLFTHNCSDISRLRLRSHCKRTGEVASSEAKRSGNAETRKHRLIYDHNTAYVPCRNFLLKPINRQQ